jgi:hypothetical protein
MNGRSEGRERVEVRFPAMGVNDNVVGSPVGIWSVRQGKIAEILKYAMQDLIVVAGNENHNSIKIETFQVHGVSTVNDDISY